MAYHWFEPGRTRRPVRGGKHWVQIENPERYEKVSDDLLIELFYPASAQKTRRTLASRARKELGCLEAAGEARIVKGRLLPPNPKDP